MPFGLTNAPRVFQKFMNRMLRPISNVVVVYLDDVHSKTEEQALTNGKKILKIIKAKYLTLNFKKCAFLKETVKLHYIKNFIK